MPTTDKYLVIMSLGEIAIAKRRFMLEDLKKKGDPFTGRFICDINTIAHFAKQIVEKDYRIDLHPSLMEGVGKSFILMFPPPFCEDLSLIDPIKEKLKERMEKYRIGESLWMNTYSFKDFEEMIHEILEVLFSVQPKMLPPIPDELDDVSE